MKKTSSTVTLRIENQPLQMLRREAESRGLSLNGLANQIFSDYVGWIRYMEKHGTIVMNREGFKEVLEALDEKQLVDLARKIASTMAKDFILFKWKEVNLENVLGFIEMYLTKFGYGYYEMKGTRESRTFSIRHGLGKKGSTYLAAYLETVFTSLLSKSCESTLAENSLTLTCPLRI